MLRTIAKHAAIVTGIALSAAAGPATVPTSQPTDSATDWLMGTATTQPVVAPASQPAVSPLVAKHQSDPDQRHGTISLSDGSTLTGTIGTTVGKPLRTWDEDAAEYRDMPMRMVKSIKAQVLWERDEPEWRFKESGSDVKVYTGKTYPARETTYVLTLSTGKTIKGSIVAPLYTRDDQGNEQTFILHKRDKGIVGQTLKDLVYVVGVEFDDSK